MSANNTVYALSANNANIPTLDTDLNVAPYYDDFNPDKNYKRILINPALGVQGRELTQMQTSIQYDQAVYMSHFFKEGSRLKGGEFKIDLSSNYLRLADENIYANNVNVEAFIGEQITGGTSNVHAIVVATEDGEEDSFPNTKTVIIKYIKSSENGSVRFFEAGENITSNGGFYASVLDSANSVGNSSIFTINEGYVFAKGFPVKFETQSIILDKYSNRPSCKVGFIVSEEITTFANDATLYDPAAGFNNYAAPGADRLKLVPELKRYQLNDENIPTSFIEMFTIKDGIIQDIIEKTQYSDIRDELARRTYDESGDYVVRGLDVRVKQHLDTESNDGYLTLANGGNTELLAIGIEPGLAYVKGFDYQNLVTRWLPVDKAIDYKYLEQAQVSTSYGSYVVVDEFTGPWPINDGTKVSLYDTATNRISTGVYGTTSASGNQIGTARVKFVAHEDGVINTSDCQYRMYLYDIEMSNAEFREVRSIFVSGAGADTVLISNNTVLYESTYNSGIHQIPISSIRSIRDKDGDVNTIYQFTKSFNVTIAGAGTFTLNTGLSDETFPYSTGLLNNTLKTNNFTVALTNTATTTMSGTISGTANTTAIVGTSTNFLTKLNVGDNIQVGGNVYKVATIGSNTTLTTSTPLLTSPSGSAWKKYYEKGQILDFTVNGGSGVARTINITSSTTAAFDLKETLDASVTATVITNLEKTTAQEKKKIINKNKWVRINCSSHSANTAGPWCLGTYDVYQINSILLNGSSDVKDSFVFDNGQRDTHYGLAWIGNKSTTLSNSSYLLVNFDHFTHDTSQGIGYLSVDSYPIDDINEANSSAIMTKDIPVYYSSTGYGYDLRDCIDMRPHVSNTVTPNASSGSAPVNPGSTESMSVPSGGLHTPTVNENMIMDLSYYMARRDLAIIDVVGNYKVIRGIPGMYPVTPAAPDNSTTLASIYIPPYPSLPFQDALESDRPTKYVLVDPRKIRSYTMRDIGVIDQNVRALQYYMLLSQLEKDTKDMKVLDADGLDRYKNGFMTDPFTGHNVGDTASPEYKCAIDPIKKELRPEFELNSIRLAYDSGNSTGVTNRGALVTLPYTHQLHIDQSFASSVRNSSGLFWNWIGNMQLFPDVDFWTDTTRAPDLKINFDGNNNNWVEQFVNAWGTQWNDWQTLWSGSSVIASSRDVAGSFRGAFQGGNEALNDHGNMDRFFVVPETASLWSETTLFNNTQTIQNTSLQERTGIRQNVTSNLVNHNMGDRVIDSSLIPYMRSRIIYFYATGLKPSTRMYPFFDGVDVSEFCGQLPLTLVDGVPTISVNSLMNVTTIPDTIMDINNELGSSVEDLIDQPLVVDNDGNLVGFFIIPNNDRRKFTVGTKIFRLTDNITNSEDSGAVTSSVEAKYSASGLNNNVQNTTITTREFNLTTQTVTEQRTLTSTSTQTTQTSETINRISDPIVQTINIDVDELEVAGIFATKFDLYFQSKSTTNPIVIDIREMENQNLVSNRILPFSRVVLYPSLINVSEDSSVATSVEFPSVVFLQKGKTYAIHIQPIANDPNYRLWTSKLGDADILTERRITQQPYSGSIMVSSNDKTWTAVQEEDLKFKLYRAKFTINVAGTARFNNAPEDILMLKNIQGNFDMAGDVIHGATSNAYAIREQYLPAFGKMIVSNKTGTFSNNETIYGGVTSANAEIDSLGVIKYDVYQPNIKQIVFPRTDLFWEAATTSNAAILSSYNDFVLNDNNYCDAQMQIYSNGSRTNTFRARGTLITDTDFISPVIDLDQTSVVLVHNLINNTSNNELLPQGGEARAKYLHKKVVLASGQDAEDLLVRFAAYVPPSASIEVYGKILNAEDGDILDDRGYIPLVCNNPYVSSKYNREDFRDVDYQIDPAYMTGEFDAVQYVNSQEVTFTGFKIFIVKIVLLSSDSAFVPRVRDLQVLAMQK